MLGCFVLFPLPFLLYEKILNDYKNAVILRYNEDALRRSQSPMGVCHDINICDMTQTVRSERSWQINGLCLSVSL